MNHGGVQTLLRDGTPVALAAGEVSVRYWEGAVEVRGTARGLPVTGRGIWSSPDMPTVSESPWRGHLGGRTR